MGRLGISKRGRTQRGAAAVEFALVMPLLLLLVFGLIQYGLYFWAYQGGSDAARAAARLAAVGNPVTCDDFRAAVRSDIANVGDEAGATITRNYDNASGTDVAVGDTVTITVEFDSIDLNMPFLPFIDDGVVHSEANSRV